MGATLTAIPRQITSHLGLKPRGMSWVETGAGIMGVERPRAYIEIVGKSKSYQSWYLTSWTKCS
jgi:hypothetical protein